MSKRFLNLKTRLAPDITRKHLWIGAATEVNYHVRVQKFAGTVRFVDSVYGLYGWKGELVVHLCGKFRNLAAWQAYAEQLNRLETRCEITYEKHTR